MRAAPDVTQILTEARIEPVCEVTSWLGSRYLGQVEVTQGEVKESSVGNLLGSCELTVSSDWAPTDPGHPLAAAGQELVVRRGFRLPSGEDVGWCLVGRYRISSAQEDGGWVKVEADSVDCRLDLARWVIATRTAGSFAAQVRAIAAGVCSVDVRAADRTSAARVWEQGRSRRESLVEVLDSWGCVLRMRDGRLVVEPTPTSTAAPSMSLHDGVGGTVRRVEVGSSDGRPNAVVASTSPGGADEAPVSKLAAIEQGPYRWGGAYGQVPTFFSSPLLTTPQQCLAAARTRLDRIQRETVDLTVQAVTDPRLELDDVVRVLADDVDVVGRVTELTHALTPGKEPGQIGLTVLRGRIGGATW